MAYKVKITMTRESTDTNIAESLAFDQADDIGLVGTYLAENNGTVERSRSADGLVSNSIYTFDTQADWQAFYNSALAVWNRNNLASKASTNNVTIDFSVIENT